MTIADPKREPFVNPPPVERKAPGDPANPGTSETPSPHPRRDPPDDPAALDAPPAREPGTPPYDAADDDAHEGATEDQVGDRTGPGAGYDEMAGRKTDRRH